MLKKCLLGSLLVAVSLPAGAFEVKPGLWETTVTIEGEAPPEVQQGTYIEHQCITAEEARDFKPTIRQHFSEEGFQEIDISDDTDTLEVKASKFTPDLNVDIAISSTRHSDKHFSTRTHVTNVDTMTSSQESHWVSEDC
ncbi:DUF3617 family protein [Halomonas sp. PAMB 3264]|uniref:DUF3617 domain-containing protein n=1 Tax=Halomonas sp. PAMB 3264 TaxID=3075222 RepID=UPI00289DA18C|nr:DUF3617 family protein [Halomonas sp. PAMB 3264]WNL43796.1 DUF3617 family protein [Halomonas sp. PAMB 3264]